MSDYDPLWPERPPESVPPPLPPEIAAKSSRRPPPPHQPEVIPSANAGKTRSNNDAGDPTLILVAGLLGFLVCQLASPVAWWLGHQYRAKMKALGEKPEDTGTIGWVLGIIGTMLLLFACAGVAIYLVVIFFFVGMAATAGSLQ